MRRKDVIHKARTALLIIDMLNPLDFPEGRQLLANSKKILPNLVKLKSRARRKNIPIIYVNDNFGQWKSEAQSIYERCQGKNSRGRDLALQLRPEETDYFVIKPKHSAFFSTTLSVLLEQMGVRNLIVTGIATDICILFSVFDAYVRNFDIIVPEDCTAAEKVEHKRNALELMKKVFNVNKTKSSAVRF